ncbi:hypothetical protein N7530_000812 [Penicillium desertorum]|uniref:Uncharacterized protein n=1 Tax=Penicillium desertorum TaxID=1303715 RepID=A0A9X0BW06_9EURO|nr:hypothetical protein N7530_000812 [Penicillium desertorum]
MDTPKTPGFQRSRSDQRFNDDLHPLNPHILVFDDKVSFNTQASTQIDGLRHFAYQESKLFYNGHTEQSILDPGSTGRTCGDPYRLLVLRPEAPGQTLRRLRDPLTSCLIRRHHGLSP